MKDSGYETQIIFYDLTDPRWLPDSPTCIGSKRKSMKLNKNKLLKFIRNAMLNLGYIEFDDSMISDANLFVKHKGYLFLTIGFTIHRTIMISLPAIITSQGHQIGLIVGEIFLI